MQRPGLFLLVSSCFLLPEAPSATAAVIFQAFERPLAPGINRKEGSPQQLLFEGKAVTFQWKSAPYAVDLDGNGTHDLTFVHNIGPIGNHTMSISLTGLNQIYALAAGVAGNYHGSRPISLTAGTEIGPSLSFDDPRLGWHNDDDLGDPPDLYGLITNDSPSFTRRSVALRFEREGALHYSWMSISARDTYDGTGVYIHAWAWESEPGKGILAGAIPEPGAGWLAMAGGWLVLWRRRRA